MKTAGVLLCLLALLPYLGGCGGMSTALADNVTVAIENFTGMEIYPRIVIRGSGTRSMDYPALPSNGTKELYFGRDMCFSMFFATGCYWNENSANLMNCSSGDCHKGSCTAEDQPVATLVEYDSNTVTTSMLFGYNLAVDVVFLCDACPSVSCVISLSKCPETLRIYDESGLLVACRAGCGLPSGRDCTAPLVGDCSASSNDFPPAKVAACSLKNVILKITVTSRG